MWQLHYSDKEIGSNECPHCTQKHIKALDLWLPIGIGIILSLNHLRK